MKKKFKRIRNNFNPSAIFQDLIRTCIVYLIASCAALCLNTAAIMGDNIFGVYMLAVAFTAYITSGYFWGILASVGGVVGVNFFFTFPYFALNFSITGYQITFSMMLLLSVLTSFVTSKVKIAALLSAAGKKRAEILTEMGKAILSAGDVDTILDMSAEYFSETNQCSAVLYAGSPLQPEKRALRVLRDEDERLLSGFLETQVAQRAYDTMQPAGAEVDIGTHNCKGTYFPIIAENRIYGVVGLLLEDQKFLMDDSFSFINVMISQTILALQRQQARQKTQEVLLETEKEKMRSNLLRAVSHDLRTPLTGIIGSATTLLENGSEISSEDSRKMLTEIQHDAEWLIHMVENLLSVTRITGGATNLKKQDEMIEEVVGEAVGRIRKRFPEAVVDVEVPEEVLIVPMDATLIEQVLINLMENAIRHSGSTSPIRVRVSKKKSGAVFTISDYGKGIDPSCIPDIFDGKSQQGSGDATRGIGIGLSICKSIILAHDGKIFAKNNLHGGASFTFVLPLKGESAYAQQGQNHDY